jgi:hypothetical protein
MASKPAQASNATQVKLAQTLLTGKPRQARFKLDPSAPRVEGTAATFGENAYITRGIPVNGGADMPEHLVLVNGDRQTGFSLVVVAAAIAYGVIPRESVEALLTLAR